MDAKTLDNKIVNIFQAFGNLTNILQVSINVQPTLTDRGNQ